METYGEKLTALIELKREDALALLRVLHPRRWLISDWILQGNSPPINLSNVEYIWWPHEGGYNFLCVSVDVYYARGDIAWLQKFYGEFDYGEPDYWEESIDGLPIDHIIQLRYNDEGCGDKTFVYMATGDVMVLARQEADEKIALQKAFFRESLDESAVPYLLEGLENANSGYRFRCAEALAKLGRIEGKEFLDKQFQSDDIILKVRAADALARVGDKGALIYLQEVLEESPDADVQSFAKRSLREIGKQ